MKLSTSCNANISNTPGTLWDSMVILLGSGTMFRPSRTSMILHRLLRLDSILDLACLPWHSNLVDFPYSAFFFLRKRVWSTSLAVKPSVIALNYEIWRLPVLLEVPHVESFVVKDHWCRKHRDLSIFVDTIRKVLFCYYPFAFLSQLVSFLNCAMEKICLPELGIVMARLTIQ